MSLSWLTTRFCEGTPWLADIFSRLIGLFNREPSSSDSWVVFQRSRGLVPRLRKVEHIHLGDPAAWFHGKDPDRPAVVHDGADRLAVIPGPEDECLMCDDPPDRRVADSLLERCECIALFPRIVE